jgi:hypothetical protein
MTFRIRAWLSLALLAASAAQPIAQDRGAFVRVDAAGCTLGARRGSGFVWQNSDSVVTALHVVAGCTNISVRYAVGGGQLRKAQVTRTLKKNDLALLTVESPVAVKPIGTATTPPSPGESITAWGYPLAVRGLIDTQFRRRATQGTLRDLLTDQLRQEVSAAGMPDLGAEVILLDGGHLLPGHSGAPLVNTAGEVVAIADGGLERGAVQVNWATPAARLGELATSAEKPATNTTLVAQLFSAEVVANDDISTFDASLPKSKSPEPAPTRTAYACGAATLVKTRSRSLSELAQSADDQLGLQQLLKASVGFVQDSDRFDVYQEIRTGATVVVPEGASFSQVSGLCVSRTTSADVRQLISIVSAATPLDIQITSVAYEQQLINFLGPGAWQVDPAWSYFAPLVRFDGLIARRKGTARVVPSQLGFVPDTYVFETLGAKGGLFMGVAAVRTGIAPNEFQQQSQCMAMPNLAGCGPIRIRMRAHALANIATHLSTFPVG